MGDVVVTYSAGGVFTYKRNETSILYLNPEKIIDIQVKKESSES
ncbi:hypothetical protein B0H39_003198 [Clostridium beijerinckii]|nr:hypothetical protein [Clostridium beijerinckii]NOW85317.1 hypothetical protein [Clostridium beijerinckii]